MGDLFAAEEDQIACAHIRALNSVKKEAILLICITGNKIAAHAVAQLYEATAIDPFPAGPSPEIGHTEQLACVTSHSLDRLTRIRLLLLANLQVRTLKPGRALSGQRHLHTCGIRDIQQGQARREIGMAHLL